MECIYPGCPAGGTTYSLHMILLDRYHNIGGYGGTEPRGYVCDLDVYRVIQLHSGIIPIEGRYEHNYYDICYTKYFDNQYSGIYLFIETKLIYIDGGSVSVFWKTDVKNIYILIGCYRSEDITEILYPYTYEYLWDFLRQTDTYATVIPKDIHDIIHDYIVPDN